MTCWRPTYAGSDRCIWHTDRAKSVVELARQKPAPGERLDGALLGGLDLGNVDWLAERVLIGADFSYTNVTGVDFSDADLRESTFSGATCCETDFEGANLERARFDDADLRDADLTMAAFDEVDFSDSRINGVTEFGEQVTYEARMREDADRDAREDALETTIRTYRKLEELSQSNSLYAQASTYYRRAKDVRRQFNWREGNYPDALAAEASRWVAGYGSNPWRVIFTSLGVILVTAVLYPLFGGLKETTGAEAFYTIANPADASPGRVATVALQSLFFSVVTFTTLGYGNIEPTTIVGRYIAGIEALVGGLLMALLVAVLTRSTWLR